MAAAQLYYNVTSGGTYGSLKAAIDHIKANHANLTTDNGGNGYWADIEISGTWASADTNAVSIDSITTSASCYINIYTTGSARHSGKVVSGVYELNPSSDGTALTTSVNNVIIDGITITGVTGNFSVGINAYRASNVTIKNNIIHDFTYAGNIYGKGIVGTTNSSNTQYIYNNILYNILGQNGYCISLEVDNGYGDMYVYNNTVYNSVGFRANHAAVRARLKNNFMTIGDGTGIYSTSTNNASSDNSAPALNTYYRGVTPTFVSTTGGSEDLHLSSIDTALKDYGADLSADAGLAFTTDIDGTTRTGTWDIGADEYVSGGGATTGMMTTMRGYWGSI